MSENQKVLVVLSQKVLIERRNVGCLSEISLGCTEAHFPYILQINRDGVHILQNENKLTHVFAEVCRYFSLSC